MILHRIDSRDVDRDNFVPESKLSPQRGASRRIGTKFTCVNTVWDDDDAARAVAMRGVELGPCVRIGHDGIRPSGEQSTGADELCVTCIRHVGSANIPTEAPA